MRIGPSGACRYYTNSGPSDVLIKYAQTFDPYCPLFTGNKMSQISTLIVFGPPYFLTVAFYRKSKTNVLRINDWSITTPNLGQVVPPTPKSVGTMGTPKDKWIISYISSVPAAHTEYSVANVIPPVGAIAAVKRLPCHISQFVP